MARGTNLNITLRDRQVASVLLIVSGSVWLYLAMRLGRMASTLGPICGHAGGFSFHCPACYAATTMILAGLALGVSATRQARISPVNAARPR